jgi:hypothetical protein
MKRKYWLIFGVIQMLGALAVLEAVLLQEALLLGVAFLLWLPGTLVLFVLNGHAGLQFIPGVGPNWSLWTQGAVAVLANLVLFTIASCLLARHRKLD